MRTILISSIIRRMDLSASSTGTLLAGFEKHYAEVVRYLARRTGSIEEARSLAHDTWLRIAEREPMPEQDIALADPRAYLFTMAHNLAMNHLRRGNWIQGYMAEREQAETHAPTLVPDVADGVMYRQAIAAVEAALHAVPRRAREVFLANGLHGESQADIALRLGLSLNTIERDMNLAASRVETALHAWRKTAPEPAPAGVASPRAPRKSRRKSLAALLGVLAFGVTGTAAWQHLQRQAMRWQLSLSTPRGRQLQRTLPDGSDITLDARSRVEIDYSAERRAVALMDGAAFFSVQRDTERPFVVDALGVRVTVLGTRFGVEIDGGRAVVVQVESGLVRVEANNRRHELRAGEGLRVATAPPGEATPLPAGAAAIWRQGELRFDASPLGDATARIARYAPMELHVTPAAARLRVSGKLRVADAREWLQALPGILPVRLTKQQDGSLEIAAR